MVGRNRSLKLFSQQKHFRKNNKIMKLTLQSLATLIHERFKIEKSRIVPDATLDDLGFDSLSQIDLATLVERNAGIKIGDDRLGEISRISDLLAVVNESV